MVSLKRIAKVQQDKIGTNPDADDGEFNKYICGVVCNSKAMGVICILYVILALVNIVMGALHMGDCDFNGPAVLLIVHGSFSIFINVKTAVENLCMNRNSSGELDIKAPEICHMFPFVFGLGWLGTGIAGFAVTISKFGEAIEKCSSLTIMYYGVVSFSTMPLLIFGYILAVCCTSYAAWLYRNNNDRYMST